MRNALLVSPILSLVVACATSGSSSPNGGGADGAAAGSSSGGSSGSGGSGSSSGGGSGSSSSSSSSGGAGSSGASSSGTSSGSSGTSSGSTDGGNSEGGGGGDSSAGGDGGTVCSALPLCDGFESDTPGMQPNASRWSVTMGCNPNMQDTAADGGLLVGVDNSQSHTGKNSLRVIGGDSCGYYIVNTSAFSSLANGPLYARFYARFSGPPTPNHNGFLSMAAATGDAGGDHIRLGFQDQVIAWNAQSSDSTLPDMDTQGTTLSTMTNPNNWDCIEFSVDYKVGDIQFWLNGTPIQGLSFAESQTPVQGVNDQWAKGGPKVPFKVTSFGLGWLALNNQYTVWFDDVALSNSRIGCP